MAHLDFKVEYNLSLTTEEYRLVAMALGGRLEGTEEVCAARELADRLHTMRITKAESWSKTMLPASARVRVGGGGQQGGVAASAGNGVTG